MTTTPQTKQGPSNYCLVVDSPQPDNCKGRDEISLNSFCDQ